MVEERAGVAVGPGLDADPGPRLLTRGHPRAVDTIRAMIRGRVPHAILIGGPAGIGKTTLALDLAAGLLCDAPDPSIRPCRSCRGCRLVDRGIHPDLHRLAPAGPGDQIRIGSRENPEDGTIRRLAIELSLLPVEGGARVALIERADRMGDDAQTALLKTLEEPPRGVTLVLCADDEDRLMPTVRSRCARIRLGPVGVREIESILSDADLADPPTAARLARLSGGRPGLARSLARTPDALAARDEVARTILDLLLRGPAERLAAARDLSARAADLDRALRSASAADSPGQPGSAGAVKVSRRSPRSRVVGAGGPGLSTGDQGGAVATSSAEPGTSSDDSEGGDEASAGASKTAAPAAERRAAAAALIGVWRDVARDLIVVRLDAEREVRDPALLDDLRSAARSFDATSPTSARVGDDTSPERALSAFLARLDIAGELLEANVRAEIVVDTLLLGWPRVPAGLPSTAAGTAGPA